MKEDLRREARQVMMDANIAALSNMYTVDDNLMTVFYFEQGTAVIYSLGSVNTFVFLEINSSFLVRIRI